MNKLFCDVGKLFSNESCDSSKCFKYNNGSSNSYSFSMKAVKDYEVIKRINSVKNCTSNAHDNSNKILKLLSLIAH